MKNVKNIVLKFSDFGGPIYVGRPKGELVRSHYKLDSIDLTDQTVDIIISADTVSINSSFFLAMFGASIRSAGSRDKFLSKYRFNAPDHILESIERDISRALQERELLI